MKSFIFGEDYQEDHLLVSKGKCADATGAAILGELMFNDKKQNNVDNRAECIDLCVEADVSACSFSWDKEDRGCYGIFTPVEGTVGGGKYACMDMSGDKTDNYVLSHMTWAEKHQLETKTRFECDDFGFHDW